MYRTYQKNVHHSWIVHNVQAGQWCAHRPWMGSNGKIWKRGLTSGELSKCKDEREEATSTSISALQPHATIFHPSLLHPQCTRIMLCCSPLPAYCGCHSILHGHLWYTNYMYLAINSNYNCNTFSLLAHKIYTNKQLH